MMRTGEPPIPGFDPFFWGRTMNVMLSVRTEETVLVREQEAHTGFLPASASGEK